MCCWNRSAAGVSAARAGIGGARTGLAEGAAARAAAAEGAAARGAATVEAEAPAAAAGRLPEVRAAEAAPSAEAISARSRDVTRHFDDDANFDRLIAAADARGGQAAATPGIAYTTIPAEALPGVMDRGLLSGRALGRPGGTNSENIWFKEGNPFYADGVTLAIPVERLEAYGGIRGAGLAGQPGVVRVPFEAAPEGIPFSEFAVVSAVPRGFVEPIYTPSWWRGPLGQHVPDELRFSGPALRPLETSAARAEGAAGGARPAAAGPAVAPKAAVGPCPTCSRPAAPAAAPAAKPAGAPAATSPAATAAKPADAPAAAAKPVEKPATPNPASAVAKEKLNTAIKDWIGARGAAGRTLTQGELMNLVTDLGTTQRPLMTDLTSDFANKAIFPERPAVLLGNPESGPSVWILGWREGDFTPIHDHGASRAAVNVFKGPLEETVYSTPDGVFLNRSVSEGTTVPIPAPYTHMMGNSGAVTPEAISIHAYDPPLKMMDYYEVKNGKLEFTGKWEDDEITLKRAQDARAAKGN